MRAAGWPAAPRLCPCSHSEQQEHRQKAEGEYTTENPSNRQATGTSQSQLAPSRYAHLAQSASLTQAPPSPYTSPLLTAPTTHGPT